MSTGDRRSRGLSLKATEVPLFSDHNGRFDQWERWWELWLRFAVQEKPEYQDIVVEMTLVLFAAVGKVKFEADVKRAERAAYATIGSAMDQEAFRRLTVAERAEEGNADIVRRVRTEFWDSLRDAYACTKADRRDALFKEARDFGHKMKGRDIDTLIGEFEDLLARAQDVGLVLSEYVWGVFLRESLSEKIKARITLSAEKVRDGAQLLRHLKVQLSGVDVLEADTRETGRRKAFESRSGRVAPGDRKDFRSFTPRGEGKAKAARAPAEPEAVEAGKAKAAKTKCRRCNKATPHESVCPHCFSTSVDSDLTSPVPFCSEATCTAKQLKCFDCDLVGHVKGAPLCKGGGKGREVRHCSVPRGGQKVRDANPGPYRLQGNSSARDGKPKKGRAKGARAETSSADEADEGANSPREFFLVPGARGGRAKAVRTLGPEAEEEPSSGDDDAGGAAGLPEEPWRAGAASDDDVPADVRGEVVHFGRAKMIRFEPRVKLEPVVPDCRPPAETAVLPLSLGERWGIFTAPERRVHPDRRLEVNRVGTSERTVDEWTRQRLTVDKLRAVDGQILAWVSDAQRAVEHEMVEFPGQPRQRLFLPPKTEPGKNPGIHERVDVIHGIRNGMLRGCYVKLPSGVLLGRLRWGAMFTWDLARPGRDGLVQPPLVWGEASVGFHHQYGGRFARAETHLLLQGRFPGIEPSMFDRCEAWFAADRPPGGLGQAWEAGQRAYVRRYGFPHMWGTHALYIAELRSWALSLHAMRRRAYCRAHELPPPASGGWPRTWEIPGTPPPSRGTAELPPGNPWGTPQGIRLDPTWPPASAQPLLVRPREEGEPHDPEYPAPTGVMSIELPHPDFGKLTVWVEAPADLDPDRAETPEMGRAIERVVQGFLRAGGAPANMVATIQTLEGRVNPERRPVSESEWGPEHPGRDTPAFVSEPIHSEGRTSSRINRELASTYDDRPGFSQQRRPPQFDGRAVRQAARQLVELSHRVGRPDLLEGFEQDVAENFPEDWVPPRPADVLAAAAAGGQGGLGASGWQRSPPAEPVDPAMEDADEDVVRPAMGDRVGGVEEERPAAAAVGAHLEPLREEAGARAGGAEGASPAAAAAAAPLEPWMGVSAVGDQPEPEEDPSPSVRPLQRPKARQRKGPRKGRLLMTRSGESLRGGLAEVDSCASRTIIPPHLHKYCTDVRREVWSFELGDGSRMRTNDVGRLRLWVRDVERGGQWAPITVEGAMGGSSNLMFEAKRCCRVSGHGVIVDVAGGEKRLRTIPLFRKRGDDWEPEAEWRLDCPAGGEHPIDRGAEKVRAASARAPEKAEPAAPAGAAGEDEPAAPEGAAEDPTEVAAEGAAAGPEGADLVGAGAEVATAARGMTVARRVMEAHRRLMHAGVGRLRQSWKEQVAAGQGEGVDGAKALLSVPVREVRAVLADCPLCPLTRAVEKSLPSRDKSELRWLDEVAVDFLHVNSQDPEWAGGDGKSHDPPGGEHWVLGMRDVATGVVLVMPMAKRSQSWQGVREWCSRYGRPTKFCPDQGSELCGPHSRFRQEAEAVGALIDPGPPHSSASQGAIEREWRELRAFLRTFLAEYDLPLSQWANVCKGYEWARNRTAQGASGLSPLKGLRGWCPSMAGCRETRASSRHHPLVRRRCSLLADRVCSWEEETVPPSCWLGRGTGGPRAPLRSLSPASQKRAKPCALGRECRRLAVWRHFYSCEEQEGLGWPPPGVTVELPPPCRGE